ncbi:hypothetical protein PN466_03650 [Roseofilum reptotaenium CS-1145]|uniref:Uncharacterized protein n=1 Tax=Roseofilum reptotaenium AO1-A TaxID=1925591 RepID=A0A1L9QM32_9CYAN|nr:hypothetical protein [Roseofilum reptotaenium]MDB9516055.1 hypothetical protein [Roseofilum reptotaenium CS-1145]OJJ20750.1 hypothetical protein BI308_20375 [Roseofilum reptotaenium AO1-A]
MYSQFIHGKLVSNQASGYQLVARSADLTNEVSLKTMAEKTHRFWGARPPETPKAVGIFWQEDKLVLIKAETAVDAQNQLVINGTRGFNQHRYVFISVTSILAWQGRTFPLLSWMYEQPIPVLDRFQADLPHLSIPPLEEVKSAEIRENESQKIRLCLEEDNRNDPLFFSALSAVVNGKRLLLTNQNIDNPPENWIESILLLLPAGIRPQISIAIGTLEEQGCTWAKLVVKTNQHSSRSLPENTLWLNRATQTFEGQSEENTFENRYVDYIRDHLAQAPDTLQQLIQKLDEIVDDDITLDSLAQSQIIIRLIPVLPEEQQDELLSKYISELTIEKWAELIPQIVNEDYQQGLVFAWTELGKKKTLEAQAISLMLKIWSRLLNSQLVQSLDELQKNLPLAEILLKHGLLQQNRRTLEDPGIVETLIALCKSVVADKAGSDWLEAWKFATHLATHKLFEDEKETFSLLDTALLGNIPVTDLYKFFTFKLASLLPNIEVEQFKQSNLHGQLTTKNRELADLLDILLAECHAGLANLPKIANLIEMDNATKDNWYATFLKKWSPSWENAKFLLVEVIKETPNSGNHFSRYEFHQTYTWFEPQQPELKQIFNNLQQNYNCENWVNLAEAIYDIQKEQTEFVDSLVGNIFPVAVMHKWLPLIVNDENLRKNVIATSSAWQSLTDEEFNQLVRSSQQYVPTLTRCLRDGDSLRLSWIKGDLLHYLGQTWIRQKRIDEDLRDVITSSRVTDTLTTQDRLILQCLSWEPGIELNLELLLGVKTVLTPEQKVDLQMKAKTIVADYNDAEQTRRLLNDCAGWGLGLNERKEILEAVKPSACNFKLIIPYLYLEGKVINLAEEQQLIGLLLQLELNDPERVDLEKFSVDVFTQYILPSRNLEWLKWWRDKSLEKQVYQKAFESVAQKYMQNLSMKDFGNYIKELKTYSLVEEARWMCKLIPREIQELLA